MAIRRLVFALSTFLLVILGAPPAHAGDADMKRFKADMASLKTYSEEQEKSIKPDSPSAGVRVVRRIVGRLRTVKTAGIPDDLKAAYKDFVAIMGKMEDVFDGWPEDDAGFTTYVQKLARENPKAIEELDPKIKKVEAEMKPVMEKFDALAKKYDIEVPSVPK